jgi:hypothetical protein
MNFLLIYQEITIKIGDLHNRFFQMNRLKEETLGKNILKNQGIQKKFLSISEALRIRRISALSSEMTEIR